MTGPSLVTRYFRQFWRYTDARILVLVVATIAIGYIEGLGIGLFYPLFQTSPGHGGAPSFVARLLAAVNIPMTAAGVLPLIVGVFLFKGLLQYAINRYQMRLLRDVTAELRRRALDALARADYEHVAGANTGFYTNLIANEVERTAQAFFHFVRALSPALSATVLFAMVWFLDWRLSLVCVAMGLAMIGLARLSGSVARRYSTIATRGLSRLTSLLIQAVQSFKYLRATGSYERLERRARAESDTILDAVQRAGNANGLTLAMAQPIMILFLGAMLYYRAVIHGQDLAPLFVLLLYFVRVMNDVAQLQTQWHVFVGLSGSVDAVRDETAATEAAAEPNGTEPFAGLRDVIAVQNVDFAYHGGRQVLFGIDLQIPANSMVAFVGASGAGKTTLVDLLMGTLRPTAGRVLFDGRDLAAMDLATLRTHLGYVPQDAMLFDDTVAANIALWAKRPTPEEIRDAARRARCLEFIEQLPAGFETPVGDRGVKLSGGQRQRLAIARELLRSPDLLVLDEATSALDSESERAIQESIDQLKGKMTILIIAHRLSTIRRADRVYVLADGKVVEAGAFDELSARPDGRFRRMVELQEVAT